MAQLDGVLHALGESRKRRDETAALLAAIEHEVAQAEANARSLGAFLAHHCADLPEQDKNRVIAMCRKGGVSVG
jgi:hypothetical protein